MRDTVDKDAKKELLETLRNLKKLAIRIAAKQKVEENLELKSISKKENER
jgi:hypothetical protein